MIRTAVATLLFVTGIHAAAPTHTGSYISDGPNPQLMYVVDVPAEGQPTSTLDGSSFDNCVQITENFNFHWAIRDGMFKSAHEAFGESDAYFAVGFVADPNAANRMSGADAIVSSFNTATNVASANDYLMNSVSECSNGVGVCPDEMVSTTATNAVFNVSGFYQDGIHVTSYVRPLAGDDAEDLTIDPDAAAFYLFAQGIMGATGLPTFHGTNRGALELVLNRPSSFQCVQLQPNGAVTPTATSGASVAKPGYILAAVLVMGAASLL